MIELWYRLNLFAEKQFLIKDFADGLVVPAHLLAYYEIAMPELLKDCKLPFFVDPMSYVWGLNEVPHSDGGEVKKSFRKLANRLGGIANALGQQRIQTFDENSREFAEFIDKSMQFQLLNMGAEEEPRRQSIERIKRFEETQGIREPGCVPYALIPPYFYFGSVVGNPYSKTLYAAQFARDSSLGKQYRIYPSLCMDAAVLGDNDQLQKITADFKGYPGILVWINDFDETKAPEPQLINFAKFVKAMSSQGSEVINMYGGYFSLMQSYVGMSKLSCGICYSRFKDTQSQASGGGLPLRYYEPHLKTKLTNDLMLRLYSAIPELFSCECPVCSPYVQKLKQAGNKESREQLLLEFFGTPEGGIVDWEKSRLHFLYCQKNEQEQLRKKTIKQALSDLRDTHALLERKKFDPFTYGSYDHLITWANCLERV
jgi:hypothetical protein